MPARISLLSLALVSVAVISAQETPEPDRCEQVLKHLQQAMATVPALEADCKRTITSKRLATLEIAEGKIRFLRSPTPCGSLELRRPEATQYSEKFVLNRQGLCLFDFDNRTVTVLSLSRKPGARAGKPISLSVDPWPIELRETDGDELPTLTMFGANLDEAKNSFDFALKGEDDHYFYLEIAPRMPAKGTTCRHARISLVRSTYLPAQCWRQDDNGDEYQWDLSRINCRPTLRPDDFAAPTPDGWTRIVSADSAPTP
jgi:hypothetical protein